MFIERNKVDEGNEALAKHFVADGRILRLPNHSQSEVMETDRPEALGNHGNVVLQAEVKSPINMVYGGADAVKVMTSSSGPGISLMQEGITYMAGAELPCWLSM